MRVTFVDNFYIHRLQNNDKHTIPKF